MEDEPWDELSGPPPGSSSSYRSHRHDDEIIQGVQRNLAGDVTGHRVASAAFNTAAVSAPLPPPTRAFPPPAAFHQQQPTSSLPLQDPPAPTASAQDNYSEAGDEYDQDEDVDELGDEFNPSTSHQDAYSIRQEALKMLEVADDHLAGSPYAVHRTLSGGFMATHRLLSPSSGGRHHGAGGGEFYDAASGGDAHGNDVDADDDGEYGIVGTRWSGSSGNGSGRRLPTALSGLAYTAPTTTGGARRPYRDDPPYPMEDNASTASYASSTRDRDPYYKSSSAYGDDEDDAAVDVIAMERRNSTYGKGVAAAAATPTSSSSPDGTAKPWSSRYSVDRTLLALSGGSTSASHNKRFLDSMDRAHQRERQAARNLFGSAPEGAKSSGIFGAAGYNFRSKHVFGRQGVTIPSNQNLYVDEERAAASSLPPPTSRKSWHEQLLAKRRQRRIVVAAAVALLLFIIVMTSILAKKKSENAASSSMSPDAPAVDVVGDGTDNDAGPTQEEEDQTEHLVSFYATSDVPYTPDDQSRLTDELAKLNPSDAAFLIHLGNIQSATASGCNPDDYPNVATLLRTSPLTTFIVPGQEDWPNCPDQDGSWDLWKANFEYFEEKFPRDFAVDHQTTRKENFAFVSSGVFFAGIHVVNGSPYTSNDDPDERAFRNGDNIEWIKQMVSRQARNATAIIIFGNAKPNGVDNQSFFNSMASFLKLYGLPAMYVHASDVAETGDGTQQLYQPFSTASNVVALQVAQGGVNPPARISVAAGPKTFVIS